MDGDVFVVLEVEAPVEQAVELARLCEGVGSISEPVEDLLMVGSGSEQTLAGIEREAAEADIIGKAVEEGGYLHVLAVHLQFRGIDVVLHLDAALGGSAVVEGHAEDIELVALRSRVGVHVVVGRLEENARLVDDCIHLGQGIGKTRHGLHEAVDLRREFDAEFLQLGDGSVEAVYHVVGETALAENRIEDLRGLVVVHPERDLAGGREKLLQAIEDKGLVTERSAHDDAQKLVALVHGLGLVCLRVNDGFAGLIEKRSIGLELVEVAEVDEGDLPGADHQVAGVGVGMELAATEESLMEPNPGRLHEFLLGFLDFAVVGEGPLDHVVDGAAGDVLLEDRHLLRLAGLGVDGAIRPLDAAGGRILLEDGGSRLANSLDILLEELVHRLAGRDFRHHHVLLWLDDGRKFHCGHILRYQLERVLFFANDVIELDALLDVFGFVGEVELGHILLELPFPSLGHAGADALRRGSEDLRLSLDAALGVVTHDLHYAFLRLLVALELERAEERFADGGRAEGFFQLDGLDFRLLALRILDNLHEMRLHDLARDRRERTLHVVEGVGIVAHDILREALHHLLEEGASALQDGASELVDGLGFG